MKRFCGFLLLALSLPACAKNVTRVTPPPVLLFQYSVVGSIAQNPDLNYYFVLNASRDQTDGPTANGPVSRMAPAPGWNLPFLRDPNVDPGAVESLRQSYWTDYFRLDFETGTPRLRQGKWLDPTDPSLSPSILTEVRNLQRGKEWDIANGNTVTFTLPFDFLGATESLIVKDPTGKYQILQPTLNANIIVARGDGTVLDSFPVNANEFFALRTSGNIEQGLNSFPIKNSAALPAGVSASSVDLDRYRSEVKVF